MPTGPWAISGGFRPETHSFRRTGSAALNLAYVASGAFEVFYSTKTNPWDNRRRGRPRPRGRRPGVSAIDGGTYDLDGIEILATNGVVHDELVAAFRSCGQAI